MKITKKTTVSIILLIVVLPLLGNEFLLNKFYVSAISTILNYLLPVLVCVFLIWDMVKQKYIPKINVKIILLFCFWILLLISFVSSITYQIYNFSNLFKFGSMTFIFFMVSNIKFDKEQKKYILYSILFLFLLISLITIIEYLVGFDLTKAGIEKYIGAKGRARATFYIATLLDKYLVLNIIFCFFLVNKREINKFLLLFLILIGTIALSFTFSRTGMIILLFCIFIIGFYFAFKKKFLLSFLTLFLLAVIYFIPGQDFLFSSISKYFIYITNNISTSIRLPFVKSIGDFVFTPFILDEEGKPISAKTDTTLIDNDYKEGNDYNIQLTTNIDYSLNSRDYFESIAKNIALSNSFTGIGIGSYTYVYDNQNARNYIKTNMDVNYDYMYPHSMFWQLAAEVGILGMLIFFAFLIVNFGLSFVKTKNIFIIILAICIVLMCKTESIFYMKDIAYFGIILCALFSNVNFLLNEEKKKQT